MLGRATTVYALAVCYTTVLLGGIALSIAIYDGLEIVCTETIHPVLIDIEKDQQRRQEAYERQIEKAETDWQRQQLQLNWEGRAVLDQRSTILRQAQQSLIKSSIQLLICGVFFLLHWRLAKKKGRAR